MRRIAGIDPMYTCIALTLTTLEPRGGYADGTWERRHIRTDFYKMPDLSKKKKNLKVVAATNERLKDIFITTFQWLNEHQPDAVGVEAYRPFPGKTGNAHKMIAAVVAVKCAVFAYGKVPMEYDASETRRIILGRQKGTKEEVWAEVEKRYNADMFPWHGKANVEHLKDSRGVAENVACELIENHNMTGLDI